jgi:hypothetical protein
LKTVLRPSIQIGKSALNVRSIRDCVAKLFFITEHKFSGLLVRRSADYMRDHRIERRLMDEVGTESETKLARDWRLLPF